ncbi:hypothetical protein ABTX15_05485 [Micromonospora sp. NPDC094482]|uniref:hypothetical protein n=1 Tax=unclassified Micromonospora TaxID=2617518 RepID=UPI003322D28A
MTTTSPGTVALATAGPGWRIAWADRENERRRRAHLADVDQWRRRADELTRQRIEAESFLGCTQPRTGLPVTLDDDELIYRVLPTAELVEAVARHVPGLPAPALSVGPPGTTGRALPRGLRVVDAGIAVVTNHRVAFAGRERRREWRYADLTGPAHHPDVPLTLLHTADPGRLAGLLVPANTAANTRFYLTLAVAAADGKRADVTAELDTLTAAHQRNQPAPPPPAQPHQAPLSALRPERRATAAAVAALAFATLSAGAYGSEQDGPTYRIGAGDVAVNTDAPAGIGALIPDLVPQPGWPVPATPPPGTGPLAPPITADAPAGPAGSEPTAAPVAPPPGAASRPGAPAGPSAAPVPPTAPAPPTVVAPPAPTGAPTTTAPAPSSPPPTTAPAPTTPPPSPDAQLLTLCLDPLKLPLLDRLLCPPTDG